VFFICFSIIFMQDVYVIYAFD